MPPLSRESDKATDNLFSRKSGKMTQSYEENDKEKEVSILSLASSLSGFFSLFFLRST
jgi:hypothetical protein